MNSDLTAAGFTTARVEAFSDGIIAIAATLLVIELRPPDPGADVWHGLAEELPSFAAFVVSFLTILIFWVNHHALFHLVRAVDRPLLFLNGLLLLAISSISFPTAVLGRALQGGVDDAAAAMFYAAVLAVTSAVFTVLWAYLRAHPHLLEPTAHDRPGAGADHAPARRIASAAVRRSLAGPALYVLAGLVALVSAPTSLVVDALVAAYFVRPSRTVVAR